MAKFVEVDDEDLVDVERVVRAKWTPRELTLWLAGVPEPVVVAGTKADDAWVMLKASKWREPGPPRPTPPPPA